MAQGGFFLLYPRLWHDYGVRMDHTPRPRQRLPRPLDTARLNDLALAYVARFATSAGRLTAYLKRKLRERGWDDATAPDIPGVVAKLVGSGYVDDPGFAHARAAGLLRRGYGARRIAETLAHDGIDAPLAAEASGTDHDRRAAALAFVRRRRLGPYGASGPPAGLDRAAQARQVAAMLRAGHSLATARALINASDQTSAEQWVDEADDA